MKKVFVLVCAGILWGGVSRAQSASFSFGDLFGQKKKQKKRLLEQIALLQVYIEVLKKGYRVVEDGLHLINDIKHGDFSIHNGYFTSLKNINPAIKKYSKVEDITILYAQIAVLYDQTTKVAADALFSGSDRNAVEKVFSGLVQKANDNLAELKTLTTAGKLALRDDERLAQIEALWVDMKDKYAFAKDFAHSVGLLRAQKHREQGDVEGTGKILDLK